MPSDQTLTKIPPSLWPIFIFVVLLFCQVWWDFAGFTFRSEDLLALGLIVLYLLKSSYHKKIGYYQSALNKPILAWAAILVIGIFITWVFSYDAITKKDALVNGVRLILAVGMFFVVNNHPAPAKSKLRAVFLAILSFSFITTTVAYLQMGFWDGWLPISLPAALTTFKEGANMAQGRELFALYLGNTGSHTWSGALAMQGLLVWLVARYIQKPAFACQVIAQQRTFGNSRFPFTLARPEAVDYAKEKFPDLLRNIAEKKDLGEEEIEGLRTLYDEYVDFLNKEFASAEEPEEDEVSLLDEEEDSSADKTEPEPAAEK